MLRRKRLMSREGEEKDSTEMICTKQSHVRSKGSPYDGGDGSRDLRHAQQLSV